MQVVASSRKPMIPGLVVKSYASQSIANQGSKFRNEVSPEVSPEIVVALDPAKGPRGFSDFRCPRRAPRPLRPAWMQLIRNISCNTNICLY